MHAPLKHKRIIAIWFIVTWPKVSRMSDLVNIDHPHHKSINYNWKHSKRIEWLRETELQHTKSCQATNSYTKWGKMTDPVLGNLWYFQLCRSNNVTAQYIELDLTWKWVGAEKLELHVRYLHSSRLSAFLARRPDYKGMREAAARTGQACCPGCCWAGEHVSRWDDGTQATTMACPKAWVQLVLWPFHPSGVYLAQQALLYFPGLENTQGWNMVLKPRYELLLMHLS